MWAVSLRPLGDVKAVGGGIRLMARGRAKKAAAG